MKLRHLFTINIFLAVFFGVSCSLFPRWVLQLYSLSPDAGTIWVTRLVGGAILGYATLMWFGRRTDYGADRGSLATAVPEISERSGSRGLRLRRPP